MLRAGGPGGRIAGTIERMRAIKARRVEIPADALCQTIGDFAIAVQPCPPPRQGDSVLKRLDKIGLAGRRRPDSRCCANRVKVVADVVGGR
jgi:hypothetical protein